MGLCRLLGCRFESGGAEQGEQVVVAVAEGVVRVGFPGCGRDADRGAILRGVLVGGGSRDSTRDSAVAPKTVCPHFVRSGGGMIHRSSGRTRVRTPSKRTCPLQKVTGGRP